jgi:hypothetical protein
MKRNSVKRIRAAFERLLKTFVEGQRKTPVRAKRKIKSAR